MFLNVRRQRLGINVSIDPTRAQRMARFHESRDSSKERRDRMRYFARDSIVRVPLTRIFKRGRSEIAGERKEEETSIRVSRLCERNKIVKEVAALTRVCLSLVPFTAAFSLSPAWHTAIIISACTIANLCYLLLLSLARDTRQTVKTMPYGLPVYIYINRPPTPRKTLPRTCSALKEVGYSLSDSAVYFLSVFARL